MKARLAPNRTPKHFLSVSSPAATDDYFPGRTSGDRVMNCSPCAANRAGRRLLATRFFSLFLGRDLISFPAA